MIRNIRLYISAFLLTVSFSLTAQNIERPIILVKASDKTAILEKIKTEPWAKETYVDFIEKLNKNMGLHTSNPDTFLKGLPFEWEKGKPGQMPPFYLTYHIENGVHKNLDNATKEEFVHGKELMRYLQLGIDCGIAYYLTDEERYAQCAVDILNAFVKGVSQSKVSTSHERGGWLFPDDGFREVREIGYKVPLIYDFVATYIQKGGKPYDIIKKARIVFPQEETQSVFRTYADISINYGGINSNHPVLEAPSLVYNALAIENKLERKKLLSYFLTENTKNQDALIKMAAIYKEEGDIWPETSQYLNGVTTILTKLMLVVNRYDPALRLGEKYSNIVFALPKLDYLVYPNNDIIRWGDGKRHGSPSYSSYENAYLLGKMDGIEKITNAFGPLINKALESGNYKRDGIEDVLTFGGDIKGTMDDIVLSRTDKVTHAGIFLQRNLSKTDKPEDGLMCFVGGASMVHGHAEGMNIELYGKGQVLGVDNGRGSYQQDIHENYSRIFAAHNTVIVNGSSQGDDSGWANLGINTVQLISMEPMPNKEAVSPNYSFTQTSFEDDKGDKAEAHQERTLALIRTSETTGYYVDVFRSKSRLPNEYHDYLYHNIGDALQFENTDLNLNATPQRYMGNAQDPWVQNKKFRNPGWHFFKDVETSSLYKNDVTAYFSIEKLKGNPIFMGLHIPGFGNREYSKVMAPHTFEAPAPYQDLPTPTLVIRKKGEAWKSPFVVVYEPFSGNKEQASVISVEKLEQDGVYKGVKTTSKVNGQTLIQYVITQSKGEVFQDKKTNIYFKGTFAVITTNLEDDLLNIYIGEGEKLNFKNEEFIPEKLSRAFFKEFVKK